MTYAKPTLEKFGSVRQLTRLGWDADCDGGIWGIGDGSNISEWFGYECTPSARS